MAMPGRSVNAGTVFVKNGNKSFKKMYLKASGGTEEQPAKLELFKDLKAANKGKIRLIEIIFTKVKRIVNSSDDNNRRLIVIYMHESDGICFYSDNETDHEEWVRYCGLLSTIPNYAIPEEPKYILVPPEFINQCTDPGRFDAVSVWVVYIISKDVGKKLGYEGLHIIAIRRNSTMNIHNFHSGKHLLSWDRDKLRRPGCIGSLVFIEAGRCYGGPGLLWMYCPVSVAGKLRECLHSFLFYGPEDGSKNDLNVPKSNSMSSSGPPTFDSGLSSISSSSHSESHLCLMQPKLGSLGRTVQHLTSQGTTTSQVLSSSQLDNDLQFPYNCGCEISSPDEEKSAGSNKHLDGGFRPHAQQLSITREQYEVMKPPNKPKAKSAPAAPTNASNYIHMNPSGKARPMEDSRTSLPSSNCYHLIPAYTKAPVENYENTGFNAMREPPISAKGTENLATIQEQAPIGLYENYELPGNTSSYVNKPWISKEKNTSGGAAAAVCSYENVSQWMNTHENVELTDRKNSVKETVRAVYNTAK